MVQTDKTHSKVTLIKDGMNIATRNLIVLIVEGLSRIAIASALKLRRGHPEPIKSVDYKSEQFAAGPEERLHGPCQILGK